jgi:hypothetical protein
LARSRDPHSWVARHHLRRWYRALQARPSIAKAVHAIREQDLTLSAPVDNAFADT